MGRPASLPQSPWLFPALAVRWTRRPHARFAVCVARVVSSCIAPSTYKTYTRQLRYSSKWTCKYCAIALSVALSSRQSPTMPLWTILNILCTLDRKIMHVSKAVYSPHADQPVTVLVPHICISNSNRFHVPDSSLPPAASPPAFPPSLFTYIHAHYSVWMTWWKMDNSGRP